MVQRPRLLAVAALAGCFAAAFLLFACGGSDEPSPEAYQRQIAETLIESREISSLYLDVVTGAGADAETCERRLGQLQAEVEALADRVSALDAPDEVSDSQQRLVEAVREGSESLGEIAGEVEAGEVKCGRPLNNRLAEIEATEVAEQAIAEIETAGYVVFGE